MRCVVTYIEAWWLLPTAPPYHDGENVPFLFEGGVFHLRRKCEYDVGFDVEAEGTQLARR